MGGWAMLSWFRKKQDFCSQDLPRVSSALAEARHVCEKLIDQSGHLCCRSFTALWTHSWTLCMLTGPQFLLLRCSVLQRKCASLGSLPLCWGHSALTELTWSLQPEPIQTFLPAAARLVAIGDIHGDLCKARRAFRAGGLIDENDRWIGGTTTAVQVWQHSCPQLTYSSPTAQHLTAPCTQEGW